MKKKLPLDDGLNVGDRVKLVPESTTWKVEPTLHGKKLRKSLSVATMAGSRSAMRAADYSWVERLAACWLVRAEGEGQEEI